jgi:hypothetical protein
MRGEPRRTNLESTRAFGQMRREFFLSHLKQYETGGVDQEFGAARDVFEGEAHVSAEALDTPVILTDLLSDRVLAVHVTTSNPHTPRAILVNARVQVDPEEMAHAIAEEVAHAQHSGRCRRGGAAGCVCLCGPAL